MSVRPGRRESVVLHEMTRTPRAKHGAQDDQWHRNDEPIRPWRLKGQDRDGKYVEWEKPGVQVFPADRIPHGRKATESGAIGQSD